MVFVNNQKFACESCIKGHRSSSCQHTDRPLYEIKKKGRPVSQCNKCRELRRTKRMHNKCNCVPGVCTELSSSESNEVGSSSGTSSPEKPRRFKPIAPALPNGIQDLITPQVTLRPVSADSWVQVDATQRGCSCNNPLNCRCFIANGVLGDKASRSAQQHGLSTLAEAAAFCCTEAETQVSIPQSNPVKVVSPCLPEQRAKRRKESSDCCAERPFEPLQSTHSKRSKLGSQSQPSHSHTPFRACEITLPPLRYTDSGPVPNFPAIPPLSAITSLAGTGCTCGVECTCPGCVQHRGSHHASRDFADCADGCGTCVDHGAGAELPGPLASRNRTPGDDSADAGAHMSFLDAFFARAAALPPPPSARPARLDATNVTVYPPALFWGAVEERERLSAAFGLVTLPPLRCGCAGGCGCPEGQCACGDGCAGCCDDEGEHDEGFVEAPPVRVR